MPSIAVPEATTAPTFKSAHFIGVGGAGMSGIALVLHEHGCRVTGSDLKTSRYIRQLTRAGVPIHVGHAASTIDEFQPDVVVVSTAIPETNPELVRARELGSPVWHRAKMLSALGYGRTTVACAGTHGKTTTSSMVATMLDRMELDPSFLLGGVVEGYGTNGKNGDGEYFVVQADEADTSFLYLDPPVVIVTNIEADHMDHYDSLEQIEETFCTFIGLVGEDGTVIVCGEDPRLVELARSCGRTVFTYGEGDGMDVCLNPAATRHAFGSDFTRRSARSLASWVRMARSSSAVRTRASSSWPAPVGALCSPTARATAWTCASTRRPRAMPSAPTSPSPFPTVPSVRSPLRTTPVAITC